jgi:nickel-dependent lactate racemase
MYINFPEVTLDTEGLADVPLPKMVSIRQVFDNRYIADIPEAITAKMVSNIQDKEKFRNKRMCLTVGSRGIPHLEQMVRAMCDVLKSWGAKPFIVPSMGSHGGATAEGQRAILQEYNITEESCGVPILSSMEVTQYGQLEDGTPLFCDKNAWEADGVVIFNKVKPHTDFRGKHESGMAKMIAIGLAKHKGASVFHMKGFPCFAEVIPPIA